MAKNETNKTKNQTKKKTQNFPTKNDLVIT